jgi:exopolysaccharide production protein ExoY
MTGAADLLNSDDQHGAGSALRVAHATVATDQDPQAGSDTRLDWAAGVKRGFDFTGGLVLLMVGLPIVLVASIAILIDDGRPIFYWSHRIGKRGRTFRAPKLRTMRGDADEWLESNPELAKTYLHAVKLPRDPRVTRVGSILRRLSLDELPQALSVVKGDMSLVGPRPGLLHEVERWGSFAEHRMGVKPGLTGLWQISGRNLLSYDERLLLDAHYIANRSLLMDIKILLLTLPAVLSGRGAM